MRNLYVIVLFWWGYAFPLHASEVLQVVTFNAPPYSFVVDKQRIGYATEVVKAALAEMSQNAIIEAYPMQRGIYKAKTYQNVLVYPLSRQQHLENDFHWIEQISASRSYLFKYHSRDDIQISSLSEAKKYSVGVVRGSSLVEPLIKSGIDDVNEVSDGIQNLLKIAKNRIDLLASDELMLHHLIDSYNQQNPNEKLHMRNFKRVSYIPTDSDGIYVAMGKNTSPEMVHMVKTAFNTVRNSGKLIEVAHFWTNEHEQAQVDIYKNQLTHFGFKWIDYTFEGGGGENLSEVLETRHQNEHLPHAMQHYAGPQIKAWAEMVLLLPLDEVAEQQQWDANLPKQVRESISYNGHYYAAPANFQRVNWMWVNSKVFNEVGLTIPSTWYDLFEVAEKLQSRGIVPFSLGGYAWQEGTLFESMVLGLGGVDFHRRAFIDLDAEAFRSETMANILKKMRKLVGYIDVKREHQTWVQATDMVIEGKAAIYFMGDWVKTIFKERGFPYGKNGFLCLAVPGTEDIFLSNVDSFVFPKSGYINSVSQNELARVIMDADIQEVFNRHKGSIPVRLDVSLEEFDHCVLV